MNRKICCAIILVVTLLLGGCTGQIDGYEAASSFVKNGFLRKPNSIGELEGQTIKLWGYVDHGNIYGDEDAKEILGDWWAGEGPSPTTWQFNLKARANDKTGQSFAIIVTNDDGRNDLLRAFLADINEEQPTKVFLSGRVFTFDASTNLKQLKGLYLEIESSSDVKLELP